MTLSCSGVVTPAPIEGSADKGSTRRAGIIGTSKGPFRGDYWEVSLATGDPPFTNSVRFVTTTPAPCARSSSA